MGFFELRLPDFGPTDEGEKAEVKGYPTWVFKDGTVVSGEVPLARLAELSGYPGKFDPALEPELRSAGVRCGAP